MQTVSGFVTMIFKFRCRLKDLIKNDSILSSQYSIDLDFSIDEPQKYNFCALILFSYNLSIKSFGILELFYECPEPPTNATPPPSPPRRHSRRWPARQPGAAGPVACTSEADSCRTCRRTGTAAAAPTAAGPAADTGRPSPNQHSRTTCTGWLHSEPLNAIHLYKRRMPP